MDDAGNGTRGLKPQVTVALAETVERVWGVTLADAEVLGGSTGLNLRSAASDDPVVVRIHRRHVRAQRVEAMQLAREAGGGAGVPIASPVLGLDGSRVATIDGCVVEVERFVESDATMDTLDRIRAALPTLAHLHDVLAATQLPTAANDLRFANYVSAVDVVERVAVGAARIRVLAPQLSAVADAAEELARRLEDAQTTIGPFAESQWCHGDFWDNNVLFRQGQVVLVTDFGFMNRRLRVDDLALSLYFTLWELHATHDPSPAQTLSTLVDAYDRGTERPLGELERDALPLAIARQPLWSIAVWAAELDDPRAVYAHLQGHHVALRLAAGILGDLDHWNRAFRFP